MQRKKDALLVILVIVVIGFTLIKSPVNGKVAMERDFDTADSDQVSLYH